MMYKTRHLTPIQRGYIAHVADLGLADQEFDRLFVISGIDLNKNPYPYAPKTVDALVNKGFLQEGSQPNTVKLTAAGKRALYKIVSETKG